MSSAALALVVLAAVLHASWNFVSKKSAAGSEFVLLYEIFALLIYFPLLFFADFNKLTRLPIEGWLLIVLSALLHVIYTVVLQTGYRKADYSVVYPTARGTGPALTVLVAVCVFGEELSALGVIGICTVLAGIVFLAMPNKDKTIKGGLGSGVFWGLLTGFFIASYSSLDGFAIQLLGMAPLIYYVPGMFVRLLFLGPPVLLRRPLERPLRKICRSAGNTRSLLARRIPPHTCWYFLRCCTRLWPMSRRLGRFRCCLRCSLALRP